MPTSPPLPLRLRTLGVHQYRSKPSLAARACPSGGPVKLAPSIPRQAVGLLLPSRTTPPPAQQFGSRLGRRSGRLVHACAPLPLSHPMGMHPGSQVAPPDLSSDGHLQRWLCRCLVTPSRGSYHRRSAEAAGGGRRLEEQGDSESREEEDDSGLLQAAEGHRRRRREVSADAGEEAGAEFGQPVLADALDAEEAFLAGSFRRKATRPHSSRPRGRGTCAWTRRRRPAPLSPSGLSPPTGAGRRARWPRCPRAAAGCR